MTDNQQLSIFDVEPPALTDDERVDQWVEWAWGMVKDLPKELQIEIAARLQMSCFADKMGDAAKARMAANLLQTIE